MTEPDVVLTDYALALACAVFAWLLWRSRRSEPVSFWFALGFLATALAALIGGTVHGFFGDPASTTHRILWPLVLLMIGLGSLAFANVAAILRFAPRAARAISRTLLILFLVYCVVVLFFKDTFLVAIAGYLPAVLFLGWAFLGLYLRTRQQAHAWGLAGIGVTLLAAFVQQARIGFHPRYFNHNALYHTLQAAGLFLIFLAARELSRRSEPGPDHP
jgi:hypothetical protein